MSFTRGYIITSSTEIPLVVKPIRLRYFLVPMVLGIISEQISMSRVVRADIHPTHTLPKALVVSTPTSEAPKVLAMVFIARMAAMGLSISVLYLLKRMAGR